MKKTNFVTFYSYKGGVGRTSALVNSAILRANKGNKVVIVDFDLEAPGVGSYLVDLHKDFKENRPGILEYIHTYITENKILSIKNELAFNFTSILDVSNGGELWVISAGNTHDSNYASKLDNISWVEIFQKNKGDLFLKNFKKQIEKEFDPDFVFIDSRTGITETGGVCTKYLADIVVVLTSLNTQNIKGTSSIYKDLKFSKSKDGDGKKFIFVASNVPVGLPFNKGSLLSERFEEFKKEFGTQPDVIVYNYPSLSLSEKLPIEMSSSITNDDNRFLKENDPIFESYSTLSSKINSIVWDKSYIGIVDLAFEELIFKGGEEFRGINYQRLIDNFPQRFFTKLIQGYHKYLKAFHNKKIDWKKVNLEEFNSINTMGLSSTNKVINRHAKMLEMIISQKIISASPRINELQSKFIRDRGTKHFAAIREMGFENFKWPLEYFKYELRENENDMSALYNLAICSYRQKKPYKDLFKKFIKLVEKKDSFEFENYGVNFLGCVGYAYEVLNDKENAKNFYEQALALLVKSLSTQRAYTSPFTYKETPSEKLEKEFKDRIHRIK